MPQVSIFRQIGVIFSGLFFALTLVFVAILLAAHTRLARRCFVCKCTLHCSFMSPSPCCWVFGIFYTTLLVFGCFWRPLLGVTYWHWPYDWALVVMAQLLPWLLSSFLPGMRGLFGRYLRLLGSLCLLIAFHRGPSSLLGLLFRGRLSHLVFAASLRHNLCACMTFRSGCPPCISPCHDHRTV